MCVSSRNYCDSADLILFFSSVDLHHSISSKGLMVILDLFRMSNEDYFSSDFSFLHLSEDFTNVTL